MQLIGARICKDEILAIGEAELEIHAFLGHIGKNVVERRKTITFEPHHIVGAEVADQVATVAPFESEGVCTTRSSEDVVASATIDRLAARAAVDDVAGIIAEAKTFDAVTVRFSKFSGRE